MTVQDDSRPTRRRFLRYAGRAGLGLLGLGVTTTAYSFWEASSLRVRRLEVTLPHLPEAFAGKTLAVLTDFHLGPYVSRSFIDAAVQKTNELQPDAIALVGDFAHKGHMVEEQLRPCLEALQPLQAPLGVFAVPGNHDMASRGKFYREAIAGTTLVDLTNKATDVRLDGQRLWFAGVDDLWHGAPNQEQALRGIPPQSAIILLSHNPDFAESNPDRRVGLVVSGHTHGGQVYLPVAGAPWAPTRYGEKYRNGLVEGPASQVFVSRGIGEAGVPVRLQCPPEINLLTLRRAEG